MSNTTGKTTTPPTPTLTGKAWSWLSETEKKIILIEKKKDIIENIQYLRPLMVEHEAALKSIELLKTELAIVNHIAANLNRYHEQYYHQLEHKVRELLCQNQTPARTLPT